MKFVNYSVFYRDVKEHGLEYAAKHLANLGFEAVEFLEFSPFRENAVPNQMSAAEAKRILEANGLSVSCYSVAVNLLAQPIENTLHALARQIAFAAEIGAPCFHHTLVPGLSADALTLPYEHVLEQILPHAVQIARTCESCGLTCLYEPQGFYFNGVEGLGCFYGRIKQVCQNVGICGDVGNGLFTDTSATEIYDAFLPEIRHVHVKDYRALQEPEGNRRAYRSRGGRYLYDCALGEGVTDFGYCFQGLKRRNYQGDISFEIEGDDETLKAAMAYIRNQLREAGYDTI